MKILQIIDTLDIGGAERMSINIANVIVENNNESLLVVSRNGSSLKKYLKSDVKLFFLNKQNSIDFKAFFKLLKIVRDYKPDIVHAHSTSIFWAVLLKIFIKTKLIWHDHYGLSDQLNINNRKFEIFISRWIDKVIVVNEILENWAKKSLHIKSESIVYIRNFPYLNIPKQNKNSSKKILLNLANFRPQKDQLNLVRAVSILKSCGIEFELWLAGAFVDKEWHNKVKELIIHLNVEKEIKILGPIEDASEILSMADIGILSSESEGLPVSLLEYGLAGLPVIVTDVGQCAEVVEFGKFGIVVKPKDSNQLAQAILQILNDSILAKKMGETFKNHIEIEYGAQNFLKNYTQLIKI